MNTSLPAKQGLYDPWFEHDACGVGVVANINGKKSNKILKQALVVLHNMDHRGGQGADANSGDGAGVLLQIPHNFFVKECAKLDIDLPECITRINNYFEEIHQTIILHTKRKDIPIIVDECDCR